MSSTAAGFESLLADHHAALLRLCERRLRSLEDAEDAVQDTFVAALQHPELLRAARSLHSVLRAIAINKCHDLRRRRQLRTAASLEAVPEPAGLVADHDPAALGAERQDRAALQQGLEDGIDHLLPKQRAVARLRYLEGRSYREISTRLHMALGTVKSRLHRVHDALRSHPVIGQLVDHLGPHRHAIARRA